MSRRERLMLMVGIILLGGVCLKFFIYDPEEVTYTSLVATRDDAAGNLRRNQQIMLRADQVRLRYSQLEAQLAAVEAKLPKDSEIPALLTAMERFTKQLGMGMVSISPGELQPVKAVSDPHKTTGGNAASKAAPYSSMPVRLVVRGTFPHLVQYFQGLRDFPRLIVVDGFAITPDKVPQLTMSMDTEIYVLDAPQTVATSAVRPADAGTQK